MRGSLWNLILQSRKTRPKWNARVAPPPPLLLLLSTARHDEWRQVARSQSKMRYVDGAQLVSGHLSHRVYWGNTWNWSARQCFSLVFPADTERARYPFSACVLKLYCTSSSRLPDAASLAVAKATTSCPVTHWPIARHRIICSPIAKQSSASHIVSLLLLKITIVYRLHLHFVSFSIFSNLNLCQPVNLLHSFDKNNCFKNEQCKKCLGTPWRLLW